MKKVILWIVAIILIIAAIGLAAYPFISDYVNSLSVQNQGVIYDESVQKVSEDDYAQIIEDARLYNRSLVGTSEINDPFAKVYRYPEDYMRMLKIDGTDVMASVNIPKINVNLPIYHGTSDEILEKGVGHVSTSSLPVGGKGTHCILTGHTGYSQLRLFSDVDQLEPGDVFFVTVLKEKLCYQVYDKDIILPEETESLQIDPEQDLCTLVTCYPFGVNTHRMLVKAQRIETDKGEELAAKAGKGGSTWDDEYRKALLWGGALLVAILFVFFTIRFIVKRIKKRRQKKQSADSGEDTDSGENTDSDEQSDSG